MKRDTVTKRASLAYDTPERGPGSGSTRTRKYPEYRLCQKCMIVFDASDSAASSQHDLHSQSYRDAFLTIFVLAIAAITTCSPLIALTFPAVRLALRWLIWRPIAFAVQTMLTQSRLWWYDLVRLPPAFLLLLRVIIRGGVMMLLGLYTVVLAYPFIRKGAISGLLAARFVYTTLRLVFQAGVSAWQSRYRLVEWMKEHRRVVVAFAKDAGILLLHVPTVTIRLLARLLPYTCARSYSLVRRLFDLLLGGVGYVGFSVWRFSARFGTSRAATDATRYSRNPPPPYSSSPSQRNSSLHSSAAAMLKQTFSEEELQLLSRLAANRAEQALLQGQLKFYTRHGAEHDSGEEDDEEGSLETQSASASDEVGLTPLEWEDVIKQLAEECTCNPSAQGQGAAAAVGEARPSTHSATSQKKKKSKKGKKW